MPRRGRVLNLPGCIDLDLLEQVGHCVHGKPSMQILLEDYRANLQFNGTILRLFLSYQGVSLIFYLFIMGVTTDSYESSTRSIGDVWLVTLESLRESGDCVRIAYLFDSIDKFVVNTPTVP
jgi:hypothetical protein